MPRRPLGAFRSGTAQPPESVWWDGAPGARGEVGTKATDRRKLGPAERWVEDAERRRHFPYVDPEFASRRSPAEARITPGLSSDGWSAPRW